MACVFGMSAIPCEMWDVDGERAVKIVLFLVHKLFFKEFFRRSTRLIITKLLVARELAYWDDQSINK